jgi:membrane associated rhomboid family serine protease
MDQSPIGFLLLALTGLATYSALNHTEIRERYLLWTDGILIRKEYERLITAGFLHGDWIHFAFNMMALLSFNQVLESRFGIWNFLLIYFMSMLGGSLLALFIHRNHGEYRALGASGAVSGVILAFVVLYPSADLSFPFIDLGIKAWIIGLLFIVISILGMKYQKDNIGHDAHLGGGITGVLLALALEPSLAIENGWMVLIILVPSLIFFFILLRNPAVMYVETYWGEEVHQLKTYKRPKKKQLTLDELLDKISKQGINSLTTKEQKLLEDYQRKL